MGNKRTNMTTYEEQGLRYFYDMHIRLWTIYNIDAEGNQISREAEYYYSKKHLLENYPILKFVKA